MFWTLIVMRLALGLADMFFADSRGSDSAGFFNMPFAGSGDSDTFGLFSRSVSGRGGFDTFGLFSRSVSGWGDSDTFDFFKAFRKPRRPSFSEGLLTAGAESAPTGENDAASNSSIAPAADKQKRRGSYVIVNHRIRTMEPEFFAY